MTDQHPLTEKICADILPFYPETEHDFIEMRAAADWQLEQVIDWVSKFGWYLFEHPCQKHEFISELKKAMRPTTQKDNQ